MTMSSISPSLFNGMADYNMTSPPTVSNISACFDSPSDDSYRLITQISTQLIIVIIMFGLGCSTEARIMWTYVKQPKQFATALALQLLLMPFVGFGLSQAFQMTQAESMGVIIQASCPGGAYSNIATYWLDGDMDLSIVMTTTSTLLALGTLPLWLFVFPEIIQIEDDCLRVPFDALGYSLLAIIVPLLLGLLVKYKFGKKAAIVTKVCSIVGSIGIIVLTIVLSTTQRTDFVSALTWRIIVVAFILPFLGLLCGYLATRVPWLTFNIAARRTIAIETAMQNTGVGTSIVVISYSVDFRLFGSLFLFPVMYAFIQLFFTFVAVLVYLISKKRGWCKSFQPWREETEESITSQTFPSTNGAVNQCYEADTSA